MRIDVVRAAAPEILEAVQRLIPELTGRVVHAGSKEVSLLLAQSNCRLVVARSEDSRIVGMAFLAMYRAPTGPRAVIEDVVVETGARGIGTGRALVQCLLDHARAAGATGVTLTSNPKRTEANALYVRMGFQRRDTNAYYLAL